MRTTLDLQEELLRAARRKAVETGTTLTRVVEDALRQALAPRSTPSEPVDLPVFGGDGPAPGVDLSDPRALRDLATEEEDARYRAELGRDAAS